MTSVEPETIAGDQVGPFGVTTTLPVQLWQGKPFWSLHTHSRFSVNDAMPMVEDIVIRAHELGYPAIGLTDHGNPSGAIQLYKAARKHGIEPLPGIELYVTDDSELGKRTNDHLTIAAYSETGYRNLCKLMTLSSQKFYFRPRVDFADFAAMAEAGATQGLVVATGCYFGVTIQRLIDRGPEAAEKIVKALAGWFPKVYVELQNHGITHTGSTFTDDDICDEMVGIATRAGLPYIVTQDSHYVHANEKPLHDGLKQLVSFSDDPDDAVFPGDGFHMVDADYLARYFEPDVLATACENLAELAERASVRLPEMENFTLKVPDVTLGEDPQPILERRVIDGMEPDWGPAYKDRVEEELSVIESSQMAGYLLLVTQVTDHMMDEGIWFQARGSASGSLVCKILGITQLDPIKRKLRFDRFLSPDRTRPPDVDLDVEHERRGEVVDWMAQTYTILQIGTLMTYSLFDEGEDEGKGSLRVRYYATRNKKGLPNIDWREIPPREKDMLVSLANRKLFSGYGKHPAGFIIAPDRSVLDQMPMSYIASSKSFIASYGKKDVEVLGFLKLDLLGVRELTAAHKIIDFVSEEKTIDWEAIPEHDRRVYTRIASGDTEAIFQLKGWTMRKGCERLKPKSLDDVAAAMALFRPSVMDSGATTDFIARRRGKEKIPERHGDIMAETKDTYGILLYQEQVIAILRRMAMPADELTDVLDAVKASNDNVHAATVIVKGMLPRIRQLATDRGWNDADIDWLVEALVFYGAGYSFNKAHADQYAVTAYRMAWLAQHHPLEFWCGALIACHSDYEKLYIRTAREHGVRILAPHVNESKISYSVDRKKLAIRKGFTAIHGVGLVAGRELEARAPFTSLADLGQRCLPRKVTGAKHLAMGMDPVAAGGNIAALYDAGALEGLS